MVAGRNEWHELPKLISSINIFYTITIEWPLGKKLKNEDSWEKKLK